MCKQLNWDEKLCSLEKLLNLWSRRHLTIYGRIVVTKALAMSKIMYLSSVVGMPKDISCKVQSLIDNFVKRKRNMSNNVLASEHNCDGVK